MVKLPVLPDTPSVKLPVVPDNEMVKLPVLPGKILDLAGLWSASLLEEATSMESVTL